MTTLLGCSTQSTLTPASFGSLQTAQQRDDGSIRMLDGEGRGVHVRPQDTLKITLTDGQVVELQGKFLCRAEQGLSRYRAGGSCGQAEWIGAWEEISSIEVDQFDGASTVAISTVAAVVVVGAVIALASESKSGSKSSTKTDRILATPSAGSGGATPRPAAPSTAPVRPRPSHRRGYGARSSVHVLILPGPGSSSSSASGPEEDTTSPLTPDDRPLFSDREIRRAIFQLSLRAEAGACVGSQGCTSGSLRIGALLGDLVDLSGGIRWEQIRQEFSPMALLGVGLQGRFPRHPSLALMLGTQFAFGEQTRITPQAGMRFHLGEGFWLGVQPLAVTFFLGDRVAYSPSIDVAYAF